MRARVLRVGLLLTLTLAPPGMAKAGFGRSALGATLVVVHPARCELTGRRLGLVATSLDPSDNAVARRLAGELESELNRRGYRVLSAYALADATVGVRVLSHERSERREGSSGWTSWLAALGGRPSFPSSGSDSRVSERLRASYTVTDHAGAMLDADTLEVAVDLASHAGESAPPAAESEERVLTLLVDDLAGRLSGRRELVRVPLPGGPLEPWAHLGAAGAWKEFRDALAALPATGPGPDRDYGLGLATEALAFSSDRADEIAAELERAIALYCRAGDTAPGDPILSPKRSPARGSEASALVRARTTLAEYRRALAAKTPLVVAAHSALVPTATVSAPLTNAAVLAMSEAGVPADVIVRALEAAASTAQLDVSPAALIALASAHVDRAVILRMQTIAAERRPRP
jgi:hypothetical protein